MVDNHKTTSRVRLDFIDGMRGIAAFYVMLGHAFKWAVLENGEISSSLSPTFVWATRGLMLTHYAVAVFIVLSGFCLMLPVVCAQDQALPGGLMGFAKRRARRILPPYYAALAFVLVFGFASDHFMKHANAGSVNKSTGSILSHVLLLHNLSAKYCVTLDGPMWSVAWEWQIYFLFALMLLPVWRRYGIGWTLALAFSLGFLPLLALPGPSNFSWTCPWYVGLFALGMAAAVVMGKPGHYRLINSVLFQNSALLLLVSGLLLTLFLRPLWLDHAWIVDTVMGVFAALFILACANKANANGWHTMVVKGLESRSLMLLGAFSYSLYLVHYPILAKIHYVLEGHHFSHYAQCIVMLFVGLPVCLFAAYLFHLAFERPFMPGHPKKERQAEAA